MDRSRKAWLLRLRNYIELLDDSELEVVVRLAAVFVSRSLRLRGVPVVSDDRQEKTTPAGLDESENASVAGGRE